MYFCACAFTPRPSQPRRVHVSRQEESATRALADDASLRHLTVATALFSASPPHSTHTQWPATRQPTAHPAASDADVPMGTIATGVPVAARVVAPPCNAASKGFPAGSTACCSRSVQAFPIRFVVVDNSGSMNSGDGSRLMKDSQGNFKVLRATRWQELRHAHQPERDPRRRSARAPTSTCSTRHPSATPPGGGQYLSLCTDAYGFVDGRRRHRRPRASRPSKGLSPTGTTPPPSRLHQIINTINPVAEKDAAQRPEGRRRHRDRRAAQRQERLPPRAAAARRLPVFPDRRLAPTTTTSSSTTRSTNRSSTRSRSSTTRRARRREIRAVNPWLTYGQPLHLAREFGLHDKLYDILDEQPLLASQAKQLIERLFGAPSSSSRSSSRPRSSPRSSARSGRSRRCST